MKYWMTNLIEILTDWFIKILTGWLIEILTDSLPNCLTNWPTKWTKRLINRLTYQLTDWLSCVQGFPAPKISWMFNGKKRMTAHKLEIPSLKVTDAGIYQVQSLNHNQGWGGAPLPCQKIIFVDLMIFYKYFIFFIHHFFKEIGLIYLKISRK